MRPAYLICLVLALPVGLLAADDREDMLDQKSELERLQEQLSEGKQVLDSLRGEEVSVQKRISKYDENVSSNRKKIDQLGQELSRVRGRIGDAESALSQNEESYERIRRRFLGDLRQFYRTARASDLAWQSEANREILLSRQINYLRSLAGFQSGEVASAAGVLEESIGRLEDLTGQSRQVAAQKKDRETAVALDQSRMKREQKRLATVHRRQSEQADHVLMLQQAAEEMARIIARLQESRPSEEAAAERPELASVFESLKGHLLPPYPGKVVTGFGSTTDKITNLKSFSPGIIIGGKAGTEVKAVAAGIVAYVGELRGYGSFVILDHGDEYFTTYAGLGTVTATEGRLKPAGEALGTADSEGRVRFELRQGRRPLDPLDWLRNGSY